MEQVSRRARRAFVLLALAAAVAVPTALGGAAESTEAIYTAPDVGGGVMLNETSEAWFVELSTTPATFRANAKAAGISVQQRFEYSRLWKGVSIATDAKSLSVVTRLPGVKAVYPVVRYDLPETGAISPELATAIEMTGAGETQRTLGYTGAGVKVAVMDTGVDYDHADLGGDGTQRADSAVFPTARVTDGWDFVGDTFNADPSSPAYNPNTAPDGRPDDCNGHGTHVAGIVGANGDVVGVAPDVTFGAYRVFGCEGSTTADIMLAAMERAEADGMDILNMSIGSAFMTWPQYPTAVGADALVDGGMIVVASIGNSGANGVYSAGAPGVGNKVIGVASFDNSFISALTFRTNPANTQVPYLQITSSKEAPTSGTTPEVVYVGRGCPGAALAPPGPDDPYLANPSGKVALIDRGACTFDSKYQRAIDAGAVAVVIANNTTGLFSGGGIVDRGFPAVGISQADGNTLKAEINAGPTTLTWTSDRINSANPTGGTASSFTSYGLTAELKLKPNIGAPGGLIRSTYPLEKGAYAIVSGTSMSSPHVAGAAALLLDAKPGTSAATAKQLFQNSADPVPFQAARSFIEAVHRQGAGMIDIDDAILATATVSPSEVSLGEGAGGTFTLTINNSGPSAVTYTPSSERAVATGGATNAPAILLPNQAVTFSASSVSVPAGGSATLDVTVVQPLSQGRQYGGYVRLTGDNGSVLRVPYAGFSGDYQGIQVLTSARCSLPGLFKLGGSTACDAGVSPINGATRVSADGTVFTTKNGDIPYFLLHFEHQARRLELTVLNAATGLPFTGSGANQRNPLFYAEDYLRRNSTATAFFAYAWDGTLKRAVPGKAGEVVNPVPEGSYKVRVSVLKALGDASNPAHWETWTSPSFTIDRP